MAAFFSLTHNVSLWVSLCPCFCLYPGAIIAHSSLGELPVLQNPGAIGAMLQASHRWLMDWHWSTDHTLRSTGHQRLSYMPHFLFYAIPLPFPILVVVVVVVVKTIEQIEVSTPTPICCLRQPAQSISHGWAESDVIVLSHSSISFLKGN